MNVHYLIKMVFSKEFWEERREELCKKMSDTRKKLWKEGLIKLNSSHFKKGHIPHNKDKTKENYLPLKKISVDRKKAIKIGKLKVNPNKFIKGHKQLNTGRTHFKKGENMGENHPNWMGGKSFEPYGLEFNSNLKEVIRKRDNYQCQLCGLIQTKRKLSVHHIDYNKKNNDPKNLITLCMSCHTKTSINRKQWTKYFRKFQK